MVLYIKYMVSLRCKLRVKEELDKRGLGYETIELGMVKLYKTISAADRASLSESLLTSGLELMDDKKAILIEKIKTAVIDSIRNKEDVGNLNFSDALSQALDYEYNYLSNNFSRTVPLPISNLG